MTILNPTSLSAGLIAAILIFQSVTPWWQGVIIAVVGAPLAALIALWFNSWQFKRNRQLELEKTGDQSYADLGHVVLELTDKERARLEQALQRVAEQAEKVHAKELQFLQEQLRHRGNLEAQARNRSHDAMAEVQRCVMTLRAHEEKLRLYESILRSKEVPFEPFVEFSFKTYEEIIGVEKIPMIDEGKGG